MPVRGSLSRADAAINIRRVFSMQEKERQKLEMGMQELELQYQVAVSGTAAAALAFSTVELEFEWEFHYAPAQRDSDLEFPHMTFGSYLDSPLPVLLTASVKEWKEDKSTDGIIGATLFIGALSPGEDTDFDGAIHLTFQGFAASREAEDDL